jgi:LysR family transcriptional activator of nhaA
MKSQSEALEWLNFHHLRHFWMIARHGGISRAAKALNISQSTLSEQLAELEDRLGQQLFERRRRQLLLTDAGHTAMGYAETIFSTGQELITRFRLSGETRQKVLRIGAVGPLSKNVQFDFIQPLLADIQTRVVVMAGMCLITC